MKNYLHVEKLFGIGLNSYERILNYLTLVPVKGDTDSKIQQMAAELPTNKKIKLLSVLNKDKGSEGFTDAAAHAMKAVMDIYKTSINNVSVYAVGKEFFRLISNLEKDVPIQQIRFQPGHHYYFILDHPEFEGAYFTPHELNITNAEDDVSFLSFRITLTPKEYSITSMVAFNFAIINDTFNLANIKHVRKSEEMGDHESTVVFAGDYEKYRRILTGIINTIIYTNTKDPEIESLKPLRLYQRKELSKISQDRKEMIHTIPIQLINWSFHGRSYSKEQTTVSPHFRWQPCGVGRSEVKLVWIDEHVRTYNSNQ